MKNKNSFPTQSFFEIGNLFPESPKRGKGGAEHTWLPQWNYSELFSDGTATSDPLWNSSGSAMVDLHLINHIS